MSKFEVLRCEMSKMNDDTNGRERQGTEIIEIEKYKQSRKMKSFMNQWKYKLEKKNSKSNYSKGVRLGRKVNLVSHKAQAKNGCLRL